MHEMELLIKTLENEEDQIRKIHQEIDSRPHANNKALTLDLHQCNENARVMRVNLQKQQDELMELQEQNKR